MTPAALLAIGAILLWLVATGRAEAMANVLWGSGGGTTR